VRCAITVAHMQPLANGTLLRTGGLRPQLRVTTMLSGTCDCCDRRRSRLPTDV